jgi:hypothetical protein
MNVYVYISTLPIFSDIRALLNWEESFRLPVECGCFNFSCHRNEHVTGLGPVRVVILLTMVIQVKDKHVIQVRPISMLPWTFLLELCGATIFFFCFGCQCYFLD